MKELLRLLGLAVGAAAVAGVVVARRRGIGFGELLRIELGGVGTDAHLALADGRRSAAERRDLLDRELRRLDQQADA